MPVCWGLHTILFHLVPFDVFIFMCWFLDALMRCACLLGSWFFSDNLVGLENECYFGLAHFADSSPCVATRSSPVDRGPRFRWRQWLKTLRQSRALWAAHFVGRRRFGGNRLFKNRLRRNKKCALVRLARADVFLLASQKEERHF